MKLILQVAVLAMFVGSTATSIAAEAEKPEVATTKQGEANQPAKNPIKRHSHMEEKTNMPVNEPAPHMDKEMPKDRHDHLKEKH